jgi:hypothetical protein
MFFAPFGYDVLQLGLFKLAQPFLHGSKAAEIYNHCYGARPLRDRQRLTTLRYLSEHLGGIYGDCL